MSHDHSHGHSHAAPTADPAMRRKLAIAFGLTAVMVVAQAVGSVITGSLALLTDTAHGLADATGLLVALVASHLMLRPPSHRHTWGFRRMEVVAALGQSLLLMGVGVYATIEAISRLIEPAEVLAPELLVFGVIGLVANLAALGVLSSSRDANFNMRAAFLEVLNDALGSLGVIIAAIVMQTTGFTRADTIASLFIVALIVPRAIGLFRDTVRVLLEFTPPGLDLADVRAHILQVPHVRDVHDMHASMIGSDLPIFTAHVVIEDACFTTGHAAEILERIHTCLSEHFPVAMDHATIQLETESMALQETVCQPAHHH